MKIVKISTLLLAGLGITACVTNPVTGRSSLQIANNSEIATAAATEYKTTLSSAKVITGTADANRVKMWAQKSKMRLTLIIKVSEENLRYQDTTGSLISFRMLN